MNFNISRDVVYGALLHIVTESRNLKAMDLANAIDVAPPQISRYMHGRSGLSINTLKKLTTVLDVKLSSFVDVAEYLISELDKEENINVENVKSSKLPNIDITLSGLRTLILLQFNDKIIKLLANK